MHNTIILRPAILTTMRPDISATLVTRYRDNRRISQYFVRGSVEDMLARYMIRFRYAEVSRRDDDRIILDCIR